MFRRAIFLTVAAAWAAFSLAAEPQLKDPMRPYTRVAATAARPDDNAGWRLTTIVRSGDRHVAVVNGKAVRVGDQIGGARVAAIDAWQVQLKQGDETIVIPLRRSRTRDDIKQREAKP